MLHIINISYIIHIYIYISYRLPAQRHALLLQPGLRLRRLASSDNYDTSNNNNNNNNDSNNNNNISNIDYYY